MFDYYFAGGIETNYLIEKNCNVLRSYLNDKKDIQRLFEAKKNGWTGKLMIDNGAFTVHRKGGKIDIDEYINWINSNHKYFDYVIALDEIPGTWGKIKTHEQVTLAEKITYDNYLYMIGKVICPEKLLPVVHMGESLSNLRKFLSLTHIPYICLSASKEVSPKLRQIWYTECMSIIASVNSNVQIHCLGSGTINDIEKFPFTSMDSTTSIMASSCGELCTDYGRIYIGSDLTKKKHAFNDVVKKEYVERKCKEYGLDVNNLVENQKERMKFNVNYYMEKSKTDTNYYDGIVVKENKLF